MPKQSKGSRKVAVFPMKAEAILMRAMELRDGIFELGDADLISLIDLVVVRAAQVSRDARQSLVVSQAARSVAA
jgi:hypothetical protein